jgi:hypothetical protein
MIRDQRSGRAPALIAPTDSIDLSESAISRGSRRQRKAGRPRTAGSLKPLTRASAVQAPEEPDQKDDRDRDSDQPKQQTSTHFHLLCNFDCHENVRIP